MKKLLLLSALLIFTCGFGQTPITDANFSQAIETCLSTHPVTGMCSDSEYGAMPNWDVSQVTDMSYAFSGMETGFERVEFNADISNWNVSNVTNMFQMFYYTDFNQPIGDWDVSNVTNMKMMFYDTPFNQPIGDWDVSNVTNMFALFALTPFFNQPIGDWNVSNVTNMYSMFYLATSFNQYISNWNTTNVNIMGNMFRYAESFNQDLSSWDISNVGSTENQLPAFDEFFSDTNLSTENYDNTLIGWSQQALQNDITIGAEGIFYCNSETQRQSLIDNFGWTINDAGYNCDTASVDDSEITSFSIYPNPTKEYLNIDCSSLESVSVYNILGKELLKGNNNRIDVSSFSKGVYFIKVSDGINASTKKFIKD